MSARWVITTPAPKTTTCPTCKVKRNRLSVYPEGCYACLQAASLRASHQVTAEPAATCSSACGRLPRHRGAHRPFLRRHRYAAA